MTADAAADFPGRTVRSLADSLLGPISKAYRDGGFGLTFLLVGLILMLSVFLSQRSDGQAYVLFGLGLILVFASGVLFFYKDIAPLFRADRSIRSNRELIDAVQATAIQLTEVIYLGQSLAFKHAEAVASGFQALLPVLRGVPVLGQYANSPAVTEAQALAAQIVETSKVAKHIIEDVRDALIESDPRPLRDYLEDLKELSGQLETALSYAQDGRLAANQAGGTDG